MQGINILVGSFDLRMARCAIILTGIIVRPEACNNMNMIWALEAVSLLGLSSCKLFMAFRPKGVAALSSPRRLAEKFITICPMEGWFLGTSGKSLLKKGPMIRDRKLIG